jgi:hypothetical protein
MQDELETMEYTSGPTKHMLAKDMPTEHRVSFALYTRHALATVEGKAEFDGEHLWVRGKSMANSIMLNADAEIEVWELYYTMEGERKVKLMVSHVSREGFLK